MSPPAPATSTRTREARYRLPRRGERQQQLCDVPRRFVDARESSLEACSVARRAVRRALRRCGATPAAEIPRSHQAERELANLRACVPILRNDAIDLASSGEEAIGGARQRADPLSVEAQQPRDAGKTAARSRETQPELPILTDPQPLVVTAGRKERFAARGNGVVDEVAAQQLDEEGRADRRAGLRRILVRHSRLLPDAPGRPPRAPRRPSTPRRRRDWSPACPPSSRDTPAARGRRCRAGRPPGPARARFLGYALLPVHGSRIHAPP